MYLNLTDSVKYDLQIEKGKLLNKTFQAVVSSGDTEGFFDFSQYSAATLIVKWKPNDVVNIATFTLADGISFDVNGVFTIQRDADRMNLKTGVYVYEMFLNTGSQARGFIKGNLHVLDQGSAETIDNGSTSNPIQIRVKDNIAFTITGTTINNFTYLTGVSASVFSSYTGITNNRIDALEAVSGATGYTIGNGLTLTGNTVVLGGDITEDILFNPNGKTFALGSLDSENLTALHGFVVHATGGTFIGSFDLFGAYPSIWIDNTFGLRIGIGPNNLTGRLMMSKDLQTFSLANFENINIDPEHLNITGVTEAVIDTNSLKITGIDNEERNHILYYDSETGDVYFGNVPEAGDSNYVSGSTFADYTGETENRLLVLENLTGFTTGNYVSGSTFAVFSANTENRIDTIESLFVTGATNGLSLANKKISLGGTVSESTTTIIPDAANSRQLFLGNPSTPFNFIGLYANNGTGSAAILANTATGQYLQAGDYKITTHKTNGTIAECTTITGATVKALEVRGSGLVTETKDIGVKIDFELMTTLFGEYRGSMNYCVQNYNAGSRATYFQFKGKHNSTTTDFLTFSRDRFIIPAISASTKTNILYYDTSTRSVTYGPAPTGSTDLSNYLLISDFSNYTGDTESRLTILESLTGGTGTGSTSGLTNYLLKSDFNVYSGDTASEIGNRLLTSTYASYTGTTASEIGNRLLISNFNTYSGDTASAIGNRLSISNFNSYSGETASEIGNRLLTSTYASYTGETASEIGNRLSISNFNSYSGTTATAIGNKLDKAPNIKQVGSSYTVTTADNGYIIEVTGSTNSTITINTGLGTIQFVVNNLMSSNTVTISGSATRQLKGNILAEQYDGCSLYVNGSNIVRGFGNLST